MAAVAPAISLSWPAALCPGILLWSPACSPACRQPAAAPSPLPSAFTATGSAIGLARTPSRHVVVMPASQPMSTPQQAVTEATVLGSYDMELTPSEAWTELTGGCIACALDVIINSFLTLTNKILN